jgi:hypothetical protein
VRYDIYIYVIRRLKVKVLTTALLWDITQEAVVISRFSVLLAQYSSDDKM